VLTLSQDGVLSVATLGLWRDKEVAHTLKHTSRLLDGEILWSNLDLDHVYLIEVFLRCLKAIL